MNAPATQAHGDLPIVASQACAGIHDTPLAAAADAVRSRELYKYFRPPDALSTADEPPAPPDTVLTAHAQLVAWRLGAQRAMVSLIDREIQYFVAESTKTLHLDDALQHEHPDDAIWAGCVSVPKAGRLCEHTLATLPPPDGGPACFEVRDLAQDDRFNTLDFVAGPPHFRYYVGVPLRSRKGVNIGSLFALDDKVRPTATRTERDFLAVMADNVVQHLETLREKKDRQRSTNMNLRMSAFVDPEFQLDRPGRHSRSGSQSSEGEAQQAQHHDHRNVSSFASSKRADRSKHAETLHRAASLLRDALDVEDGGGGVVFLDTSAPMARQKHRHTPAAGFGSSSSQESDREPTTMPKDSVRQPHMPRDRPADILAQSCRSPGVRTFPEAEGRHFTPMSPADLSKLINRHPRGKLFTFGSDGLAISSSSDELSAFARPSKGAKQRKTTTSQAEAALLQQSFPTARQIILLPVWDATTSRWSACFAYNCCAFRNFTYSLDFLYCVAFNSCVTTEIARLTAFEADKQKSDFIGSISHELRSPLHGILASCEFLGDTDCTSFQRSLIDTADSCGRTLLDTINMVLDYSKINAFESNTKKARRSKRTLLPKNPSVGLQSHLNLYGDVDFAAITEEVVEGVATGHVFRSGVDRHDALDADFRTLSKTSSAVSRPSRSPVDIIIDIPMRDWNFWSQPGALRRIVMNLFGNSLKYTQSGFIHIKLDADDLTDMQGLEGTTNVTLTITDSGQGISPDYMKTKLFTPFAQESSLTPGTGLGLSLVKSIVDMLDGVIDIESTVGVGTKVNVRLPMARGTPENSNQSASTPGSAGSFVERVKDDSIDVVKAASNNKQVVFYRVGQEDATDRQCDISATMRKSLTVFLEDWYGFSVQPFSETGTYDLIITEEGSVSSLIDIFPQLSTSRCRTIALVLCDTVSTQHANNASLNPNNFEHIRYPFGPYKLARVLRTCLERLAISSDVSNLSGERNVSIEDKSQASETNDVVNAVENLTIASSDATPINIPILQTGSMVPSEDSVNAQMAITTAGSQHSEDARPEFPFPGGADPRKDGTVSPTAMNGHLSSSRPKLPPFRRTISTTHQEITLHEQADTKAMTQQGAITDTPLPDIRKATRSPRMLLVDDNRINLKLLQTFMKKRKYTAVTNAEDGQQAVDAYTSLLALTPPSPPDIILMDISMPIMDGFEATRRIRAIERDHHATLDPMQTPPSCLIIALTGLASARDQSEAFTSGFDLYITKPVSFKEIARLLDNWESNGGIANEQGVPHGAALSSYPRGLRESHGNGNKNGNGNGDGNGNGNGNGNGDGDGGGVGQMES